MISSDCLEFSSQCHLATIIYNEENYNKSEVKGAFLVWCLFVTVYGKTGHNAACVNIEKKSIDFLKMYCFKRTEGNG